MLFTYENHHTTLSSALNIALNTALNTALNIASHTALSLKPKYFGKILITFYTLENINL